MSMRLCVVSAVVALLALGCVFGVLRAQAAWGVGEDAGEDFVSLEQRSYRLTVAAQPREGGAVQIDAGKTVTATPVMTKGTLVGQATTQFHGPDGLPLAVTLVRYGAVVFTDAVTLNAFGAFTVTGVAPAPYDAWVKHEHTLAQRVDDVEIVAGDATSVDFGVLHEGDANDDNVVNTTDFSAWLVAFRGAYDPGADFNLDGQVNTTDFSIWLSNFPMTGDLLETIEVIEITDIFYDGVKGPQEPDEYVEIRNNDDRAIQLEGWTLRDEADHVFTFPSHVMEPGDRCRVYTNEHHPEWCGFSYNSSSAIWNNGGDCADLRDGYGDTIDTHCY